MKSCKKCSNRMYERQAQSSYELFCVQCGYVEYLTVEESMYTKTKRRKELDLFDKELAELEKDRAYYSKRKKVQAYAIKYGINGAARVLKMPRSSVGLLAKGLSIKKFNRGKFDKELKLKVIKRYKEFPNKKRVAEEFGVSRPALQNWVKEYENHKGKEWGV